MTKRRLITPPPFRRYDKTDPGAVADAHAFRSMYQQDPGPRIRVGDPVEWDRGGRVHSGTVQRFDGDAAVVLDHRGRELFIQAFRPMPKKAP